MTTQTSAKPKRRSCLKIGIIVCLVPFFACVVLLLVILFPFEDILLQLRPYPPPVDAISDQNIDRVRQMRKLSQGGFGAKLAWSPDSRLLGVANGNTVKLWQAATGKELQTITFQSEVSGLAFSPDSSMLAVGTNVASLYDVATGRQVRAFQEVVTLPNGWVLSGGMNVAFSPNGKILAGGMMGGAAVLWEVASGKTLSTFSDPGTASPYSQVAFSPDGNILALAHSRVSLWNITTGEIIRTLPAESAVVMFLADGKTLLTSKGLWDITNGTITKTFGVPAPGALCAAYSSDGSISAYTPMPLPGIGFSGPPGAKIVIGMGRDLGSYNGCPLAYSPDGRWLATGGGPMKLWGVPP
jgi:WD40 repeat protein